MLSRKQIQSLDGKIHDKSPDLLFYLNLFDSMIYTIISGVCSEFFDLSCRSSPKKLFTTCWSVFHRFCNVLRFLHFENLKLDFSLQKLFGNLEKQYIFRNIFI